MANFDLIMPKMGESVAEATIIKWTKNEGDKIKLDETVLEIATDKVDSEIPSPFEGILLKKLFKEGDVVQVGSVIAHIGAGAGAAATSAKAEPATVTETRIEQLLTEGYTLSQIEEQLSEAEKQEGIRVPSEGGVK
mgnify:CR=1 FL=1